MHWPLVDMIVVVLPDVPVSPYIFSHTLGLEYLQERTILAVDSYISIYSFPFRRTGEMMSSNLILKRLLGSALRITEMVLCGSKDPLKGQPGGLGQLEASIPQIAWRCPALHKPYQRSPRLIVCRCEMMSQLFPQSPAKLAY